jgi:hypothetical protein
MDDILYGEIIKNIYFIPDDKSYDDIFLFKKIIIETCQFIVFEPIEETDEIKISVKKIFNKESIKKSFILDGLSNKKLIGLWYCQNDLGFQDHIMIGLDIQRPTLSFLCECGQLGVFSYNTLKKGNFIKIC